PVMGRREHGMGLLKAAAKTVKNLPAVRTAAASVFGLPDLVRVATTTENRTEHSPLASRPKEPGEVLRAISEDGKMLAIVCDIGCADGTVRRWDIPKATNAKKDPQAANPFELPPVVDVPALDVAVWALGRQHGPVTRLALSANGE